MEGEEEAIGDGECAKWKLVLNSLKVPVVPQHVRPEACSAEAVYFSVKLSSR